MYAVTSSNPGRCFPFQIVVKVNLESQEVSGWWSCPPQCFLGEPIFVEAKATDAKDEEAGQKPKEDDGWVLVVMYDCGGGDGVEQGGAHTEGGKFRPAGTMHETRETEDINDRPARYDRRKKHEISKLELKLLARHCNMRTVHLLKNSCNSPGPACSSLTPKTCAKGPSPEQKSTRGSRWDFTPLSQLMPRRAAFLSCATARSID